MTTDRFKDGVQWWMDTTKPMSMALCPNPPQWHIDTCKLVRLVPQRSWVPLTDAERGSVLDSVPPDNMGGEYYDKEITAIAIAIEAKLKEKNT